MKSLKLASRWYIVAALAVALCVTVAVAAYFLVIRVPPVCAACGYVYVTEGNCEKTCTTNPCPPPCSLTTWHCERHHWHRYSGPYSHGRISVWYVDTPAPWGGSCPSYCN